MSTQSGEDALNNRAIVPSSPFEIMATQELLQQRIENGMSTVLMKTMFVCHATGYRADGIGELTQADVDLVKQGYKWMSVSATVCPPSLGSSIVRSYQ